MFMIREMPKRSRHRERLLEVGPKNLLDEELIAILLHTGTKDQSVVDLSKHVLYHLESMDDLKKISVEELLSIKGIKLAKASTLVAAIELGRRLATHKNHDKKRILSTYDVYHLLYQEIKDYDQEHFICLYLNTRSELIKKETIFIGTINQTLIHPREIFSQAVKLLAHAVIFVHNHPTGDSTPSKADLLSTDSLMKSAELMGIHLIDHIIIGYDEFFSIKEQKKIKL